MPFNPEISSSQSIHHQRAMQLSVLHLVPQGQDRSSNPGTEEEMRSTCSSSCLMASPCAFHTLLGPLHGRGEEAPIETALENQLDSDF